MHPIGIYIHVPFCRSKCGYCDFYSLTREDLHAAYVDRVIEEIQDYHGKGITADTLFIGGGTPSLLSEGEIERLIAACREIFSLQGEITMEANPDSVSPDYLKAIYKAGINRISFGAQSGVDRELQALGRRHNAEQIKQAVIWAREAGIENLSLDVMLGIPYQTFITLETTLDFMIGLKPEHLSCYLLKIEEGTAFYRQHAEKLCADEDLTAEFYLHTVEKLRKSGYFQYEISNFSKNEYSSQHNLKYWRCEEYLGFGTAAHSFFNGQRFYHTASLEKYLSSPDFSIMSDGKGGGIEERVLLQLRLTEGLDISDLSDMSWRNRLLTRSIKYQKAGLMTLRGKSLSFTPQGFLVSNSILSELLSD